MIRRAPLRRVSHRSEARGARTGATEAAGQVQRPVCPPASRTLTAARPAPSAKRRGQRGRKCLLAHAQRLGRASEVQPRSSVVAHGVHERLLGHTQLPGRLREPGRRPAASRTAGSPWPPPGPPHRSITGADAVAGAAQELRICRPRLTPTATHRRRPPATDHRRGYGLRIRSRFGRAAPRGAARRSREHASGRASRRCPSRLRTPTAGSPPSPESSAGSTGAGPLPAASRQRRSASARPHPARTDRHPSRPAHAASPRGNRRRCRCHPPACHVGQGEVERRHPALACTFIGARTGLQQIADYGQAAWRTA